MQFKDYGKAISGEDLRLMTVRLGEILERKNADYGGASFRLGLPGVFVHVTDKYDRFANLIDGKEPNNESLKDTLLDLAGYCIIGACMLEQEEKNDG